MPNVSVGPEVGQRPQAWYRKLAYSLSRPCQNGEFALSASRTASQGLIRSSTATPSSAEEISTCTWQPQVSCSWAVSPNARAMARYRPSRTSCGTTGTGEVASAATCAPARAATSPARARHRRSSRPSSPRSRDGRELVSSCCSCNSKSSDSAASSSAASAAVRRRPRRGARPPACRMPRSAASATARGWPLPGSTSRSSSSTPTLRTVIDPACPPIATRFGPGGFRFLDPVTPRDR